MDNGWSYQLDFYYLLCCQFALRLPKLYMKVKVVPFNGMFMVLANQIIEDIWYSKATWGKIVLGIKKELQKWK